MAVSKLGKIIVVGDRVLIKPKAMPEKTRTGLFLPPGYELKEEVQSGYIVKCGPGYPIPYAGEGEIEPWKKKVENEENHYLPLQAKVGDLAIFLQKGSFEVLYDNEKFLVVPHHSILLLERDEMEF